MARPTWRHQVSPRLAVVVESSLNIAIVVGDERHYRAANVTNVADLIDALQRAKAWRDEEERSIEDHAAAVGWAREQDRLDDLAYEEAVAAAVSEDER